MFKKGSDELRELAFNELDLASKNERDSWLQHPCTRSTIYSLQADIIDMLDMWSLGNFTAETAEGTIQLNSEALGQFKAARAVLDYVEGISDTEMFEDDQT